MPLNIEFSDQIELTEKEIKVGKINKIELIRLKKNNE
jgi:hypothetical protein